MLHYTILSLDRVGEGADAVSHPVLVRHRGRCVYGHFGPDGSFCCVNLLSTDPADYLRPEYSPGTVLKV